MAIYAKTASLGAAAQSAKISLASHYRMFEADRYRKAFEFLGNYAAPFAAGLRLAITPSK